MAREESSIRCLTVLGLISALPLAVTRIETLAGLLL